LSSNWKVGSMNSSSKAMPGRLLVALYAVVSLAAILYVPYFFSPRPSASDSYVFGYNNRIGVALLLLFSIAGAIWTKGCGLNLRSAAATKNISFRTLWVCVGITLTGCIAMILYAGRFGGIFESSYEIDRVWLLSQGKVPYVDFEWPFGAFFLYGPLWLTHLLHLSVPQGYNLFWTLASVTGIGLLFATVNLVGYPSEHKTSIFLLLYAATLFSIVLMGTHYTMLRYACPLLFILIIYKVSSRGEGPGAQFRAATLALCFTACLLLLSPEMAIAHAFACVLLLFPRRSAISSIAMRTSLYVTMLAGLVVVFVFAFKLHVLDTLLASGGGADSLPIPFSSVVLFFFGVVFLCACAIVERWSQPMLNDNSVALILLSIPLLAAALGRCDPAHILFNGLGLFLAASFYSSSSPKLWKFYRNCFLAFMIVIPAMCSIWFFAPVMGGVAVRTLAEDSLPGHSNGLIAKTANFAILHLPPSALKTKQLARLEKIRLLVAPKTIDFAAIYPGADASRSGAVFQAPFGYKPNGVGSYLSNRIDYGYYEGVENANTPAAVGRKINELAAHPERPLLLHEHFTDVCEVDLHGERLWISVVFFFPYTARVSHPENVHQPLCSYISDHYTLAQPPVLENFRYGLWVPKAGTAAVAQQ
jgi:hypothetical protein